MERECACARESTSYLQHPTTRHHISPRCNTLRHTTTHGNTRLHKAAPLQHTLRHCARESASTRERVCVHVCRCVRVCVRVALAYAVHGRESCHEKESATRCNTLHHTATHCNTLQYRSCHEGESRASAVSHALSQYVLQWCCSGVAV